MINKRLEDLSKVFDRTWKANHNNTAKIGREKERNFMNKMFNVKNDNLNRMTPGQRAENLQNNIDNALSGQRRANLNNIIKKWK